MRARAKALYEAGLKHYEDPSPEDIAALKALASMVDMALPEKKERKPSGAAFQRGQDVYKYLCLQFAGRHVVEMEPCPHYSLTNVGKAYTAGKLTGVDIQRLAQWVNGGGLDWMRSRPTWLQLSRKFLDWVAQARAEETEVPAVEDDALGKLRERGL